MGYLKVTYSQDHKPFDELGVPRCHYKHNWLTKNYKFPFDLEFNRTYYKHDGEKLIAFRILAYTIDDNTSHNDKPSLIFLVQLPNQPLQWLVDFITPHIAIYKSVDEYVMSAGANCVNLCWQCWYCRFNVRNVHDDTYFFNDEFWTIRQGVITKSKGAYFNRFVITEDGFFVNIGNDSYHNYYGERGIFLDKMSATKVLLNNMSVVDFENDPITIKMKVLDNTPKLLKIQFVE